MGDLTDMEFDALKEVGNVGVGNAATALSKFLDKKIDIALPDTRFVHFSKLSEELGGAERIVTGVYLQLVGDLSGEAIFIFEQEGAFKLIDLITGNQVGNTKNMTTFNESAFKEMTNIFTGAYLSSLSKMLDLTILQSIPHMAADMTQSILDFILIRFSEHADDILMIKTEIDIQGHNINGCFMMIFEPDSLSKLIDVLKTKYGI
ncbi:chemotaxis protein CheC [Candidatus Woesearchaeota archaeon]|nr:chemotaxis protein CheC [Candidatus Woesearchaeota archaeon]